MTATLTRRRATSSPRRDSVSRTSSVYPTVGDRRRVVKREERRIPLERVVIPQVPQSVEYSTDDEEMEFVTRAMMWMTLLAVTPLILFFVLNFFYPSFLLIPIAP